MSSVVIVSSWQGRDSAVCTRICNICTYPLSPKLLSRPGCRISLSRVPCAPQFRSVQLLSCVRLFATLWTAAHLASLSFTVSWSLLKFMPIELVMLSNHLILCCPLLFCLQSFLESGSFPMSWLFALGGQSFEASVSASVLPMNAQDWFPLKLTNWAPCSPGNSRQSSPASQHKSINSSVLSLFYGPTLISMHDYWKKS